MTIIEDKKLRLNSTIGELKLSGSTIDIKEKVSVLAEILKNDGQTPGIVLMNGSKFYGILSRRVFFECMSQPFSLELYLNRTVDFLFENTQLTRALVLKESVQISEASMLALERPSDMTYEPLVVEVCGSKYKLLDIHQLLLAQSKIHLLTVTSLKEANEFKSEVLSIASHDLKNPLNSIMGFARMIRDDFSKLCNEGRKYDERIGECAEMIYNSSQRMLELIKKLLDSSSIEASLLRLEKGEIDLIALVENTIALNEELANEKDQSLIIKICPSEKVYINGDAARLGAAVDNLLSNAIKYSPFKAVIEIQLKVKESRLIIEIKDQGPGIREDEKHKLFTRFSKLSARPTGGESSTGLGLYIAKQTILLHDGDLYVESESGKGSTFIVELPLSKVLSEV